MEWESFLCASSIILMSCIAGAEDDTNFTTSGCQERNWPYPVVPGNFERLHAALHSAGDSEQDRTSTTSTQTQREPEFAFHKSLTQKSDSSDPALLLLAAVFQDVLPMQSLLTLQAYLAVDRDWRFANIFRSGDGEPAPLPWSSTSNSTAFRDSRVNTAFQALVNVVQQSGRTYHPYEVTDHIVRRGDVVGLVPGDLEGDEIILLYFLKDRWHVNSYGELLLYDNDEVFAAVKPALNRAVVWNSSLAYHIKSPSFNHKGSLFFLMVKYTTNLTKVEDYHQRWQQTKRDKEQSEIDLFPSMTDMEEHQYKNLNVRDHEVEEYTDINGRKIHMFDDLFSEGDLTKLVDHFERYGDYYFDDSFDPDSDNVQWISSARIDSFVQSRIWEVVHRVASFVSGKSGWFPYDLACNNIRACDSTQSHQDCEEWEEEWTFLVYLSKNFTSTHGGETAFYQITDETGEADYVTSVKPKFGRAVIFNGLIPHSARPPSAFYLGPRFSFAVKLSVEPWLAWSKALKQEFAHEEFLHAIGLNLLSRFHKDHLDGLTRVDSTLLDLINAHLDVGVGEGGGTCEEGRPCTEAFAPNRYLEHHQDVPEVFAEILRGMGEHGDKNDDDDELAVDKDDIEESYINLEEFPEVMLRKFYIYQAIQEAGRDGEALRAIHQQFMADKAELLRRYTRLIELVL